MSVSGSAYTYLYQYKDHLGNIRLTYKDVNGKASITDENNYYPLGMKITETNFVPWSLATAQKYRYNGQEWQDELGLNMTSMDFRQYDNAIGRFVAVDPLAELSYSQTPYHFANNNAVNFSDPSGLFPTEDAAMSFMKKFGLKGGNVSFNSGRNDWTINIGGYTVFENSFGKIIVNYSSGEGIIFRDIGRVGENDSRIVSWFSTSSSGGGGGGSSSASSGYGQSYEGGGNSSLINSPRTNVAKNTPKPVKVSRFGGGKLVNKNGTPWMKTALDEFKAGVKEIPKGSNSGPKVDVYLKYAGVSSPNAWCAAFVKWCLEQNGIKGASARGADYIKWGVKLDVPKYGAITIFKTNHVGLYMGEYPDGSLKILHGNWSDKVTISRPIYDPVLPSQIKEYRFPNFK